MAAPNLKALTSLKIDTALQLVTTSPVAVTWPIPSATTVPSGHAYQLDAIFVFNYHASQRAKITIIHKKGGTEFKIVPLLSVAAGQNLNAILGKPKYLAEGDSIIVYADTASAMGVDIPHSDAV